MRVASVDRDDLSGDETRLGIPADVIADLECRFHVAPLVLIGTSDAPRIAVSAIGHEPRLSRYWARVRIARKMAAPGPGSTPSSPGNLRAAPMRRGRRTGGSNSMPNDVFPQPTPAIAARRKQLAPEIHDAFAAFSERVFAEGALPVKVKQLIAIAVAHTTQCPYCIRGHTKAALRHGATDREIMEAIWVAAEMRAGGAYAHSAIAIDTIDQASHASHSA
jgi:AhpD family alkylhydroperoxidase